MDKKLKDTLKSENDLPIICKFCAKEPQDLPKYISELADCYSESDDKPLTKEEILNLTMNDGTFNEEDNTFVCTDCYIKYSCPSNTDLQKIPRPEVDS